MFGKKEVGSSKNSHISQAVLPTFSLKKQALISIKSISKSYRKKLILKDASFDVFSGDIFGIIGMSGSGKTTLFQLMSGVLSADSGDVLVRRDLFFSDKQKNIPDYLSVFRNQKLVKKRFGFASQMPSFYEHLTVEENLFLYGSLHSLPKKKVKENADRLLKFVELYDERDTLASELSGGMQRRLDIACSLIHDPKVLFLDEPTSDLDPVMRKQIWSLIKEIRSKGTTIVLASHILEEFENICTKVAILHNKRILGYGTLDELKNIFKRNRQVKVELEKGEYESLVRILKRENGVEKVVQKGHLLIVQVIPDDKVLRKVIKAVESSKDRLISLDVSETTLNEIFETLTRRGDESGG